MLYANFKKCNSWTDKLMFLGYVVIAKRLEVNEKRAKAIRDQPTSKFIQDVRSFHGFSSFYKRFVKIISTLVTLLTEVIKQSVKFKQGEAQEKAFNLIKEELIFALLTYFA